MQAKDGIKPKDGRGGARPGAGRKKKEVKFAGVIADAEKKIADRLPDVIFSMFELAAGVTVQETTKKGEEVIYTRAPDYRACAYLIDRILGKPTEPIEIDDVTDPENRPAIPNGVTAMFAEVVRDVVRKHKEAEGAKN